MEVSAKYAKRLSHPGLSEAVCEEILSRQLESDSGPSNMTLSLSRRTMLESLIPWFENLQLPLAWNGTWCDRILRHLFELTRIYGSKYFEGVGKLWRTLAMGPERDKGGHKGTNINVILDFIVILGDEASQKVRRASDCVNPLFSELSTD